MNRILASFTSSERNIITFVLLMAAGGYGLLHWREQQETTMVFTAGPGAATEYALTPDKVLPQGMGSDGRIDINAADKQLLETLPGIGPSLAGAILQHREDHGGFTSAADLDAVPGIGPAKLAKLSPLVDFGDAVAATPAESGVASAGVPAIPAIPATRPAASAGSTVNINSAGAAELDTLKGVGPALAQRIIEERKRGPFRSIEEITRVRGIGPKILQDNRHRLVVQ